MGAITACSGIVASGTSLKTILQIAAPADTDLEIIEIYMSGRAAPSSTSNIGILWQVMKQTTAGTMSAVTEVAWPGATSATILGTAQHTATAEPTASDVYINRLTLSTAPGYTWRGSLLVPAGTRIGITATSPDDVNVLAEAIYRRA